MATYYIGPNGNNANPGTIASPKAISFLSSLVAGDEALLLPGTYRQQVKINNRIGTASNKIRIYADSTPITVDGGWDGVTWPTLYTGANYVNMYRYSGLLELNNCEHVEISGIEVRNSSGEGINLQNCRNVIMYDCKSYKTFGGGLLILGNNSTPGTWYGPCHVYDCYVEDATLAYPWHKQTAPDGTYLSTIQTGISMTDYVENITLERVIINRCGAEGIVIGRNSRNNTVIDCAAIDTQHTGLYFQCGRNSKFERCLLLNTDAFVTAHGRNEGILFNDEQQSLDPPYNSATGINNTVRNCIVVNAKQGVRLGAVANMVGHTIENNTFINCEIPYSAQAINSSVVRATPSGNIVRNNLCFNSTVTGTNNQAHATGFTFRNNLFFGSAVPANANGAGTLTSNPLLSSPAAPYTYPLNVAKFRPTSASPTINAGFANGLVLDHTKLSRVGTPDIGALEFTTAATTPTANFFTNATSGDAPLLVNFTDTSTPSAGNTITSRTWQYSADNGATWTTFSTAQNPSYTFPAGCYQVRLTVTDSGGGSNTKTMTT